MRHGEFPIEIRSPCRLRKQSKPIAVWLASHHRAETPITGQRIRGVRCISAQSGKDRSTCLRYRIFGRKPHRRAVILADQKADRRGDRTERFREHIVHRVDQADVDVA